MINKIFTIIIIRVYIYLYIDIYIVVHIVSNNNNLRTWRENDSQPSPVKCDEDDHHPHLAPLAHNDDNNKASTATALDEYMATAAAAATNTDRFEQFLHKSE